MTDHQQGTAPARALHDDIIGTPAPYESPRARAAREADEAELARSRADYWHGIALDLNALIDDARGIIEATS